MGMYIDPESSLSSYLEIITQNFEEEYVGYWGLKKPVPPDDIEVEDWELAKALDQVGRLIPGSAETLRFAEELRIASEKTGSADAGHLGVVLASRYHITQTRLEIDLAWESIGRITDARTRYLQLIWLLAERKLSERAMAYLARATRLFVWGFEPECVIMCRSVLDTALQDRIEDSALEPLGLRKEKHGYSFATRIEGAFRLRLFDKQQKSMAHELRQSGNDAVHVAPGLAPKAIKTLTVTSFLLNALFPE